MNEMIMISKAMPIAHSVCQKHQVRKIQAGTHQICPKCAVEFANNQNREHHKTVILRKYPNTQNPDIQNHSQYPET